MARWPDFHLLKCYNESFITSALADIGNRRFVYCHALLEEMNSRGWDKLNYKQSMTSKGRKYYVYREIDPMQVVGLWFSWN